MIIIKVFAIYLILAIILVIIITKQLNKQTKKEENKNDEVPRLKELTKEQVADIHARGKITPAEAVKEWEEMDLCIPGDAIGSAAWRCCKYKYNCHNCLVDYANAQEEYTSIYRNLKRDAE